MSTNRLLILAVVGFAPWALAAESTKPVVPQKSAPALPLRSVPTFELKNKSSFTLAGGTRNPFLPIGWKGAAVVVQPVTKKPLTTADAFRVTSILVGSPSLAVINGRSYEEGQMIRMGKVDPKAKPGTSSQPRVKLYRIGDGAVQIQVEDQMITVPLKRGELNEIQPEPLLDPNAQ
jgi:hypothetical protein